MFELEKLLSGVDVIDLLVMAGVIVSLTEYLKQFIKTEKTEVVVPLLSVAVGGIVGFCFKQLNIGIIIGLMVSGTLKKLKELLGIDK